MRVCIWVCGEPVGSFPEPSGTIRNAPLRLPLATSKLTERNKMRFFLCFLFFLKCPTVALNEKAVFLCFFKSISQSRLVNNDDFLIATIDCRIDFLANKYVCFLLFPYATVDFRRVPKKQFLQKLNGYYIGICKKHMIFCRTNMPEIDRSLGTFATKKMR